MCVGRVPLVLEYSGCNIDDDDQQQGDFNCGASSQADSILNYFLSKFLKFPLKFSISSQPGWQAGRIKATLVIARACCPLTINFNFAEIFKFWGFWDLSFTFGWTCQLWILAGYFDVQWMQFVIFRFMKNFVVRINCAVNTFPYWIWTLEPWKIFYQTKMKFGKEN